MSVSNVSAPKMPETQVPSCQGKHKTRLFVGEGNFSFAESFINKHDKKAGHTPKDSLAHSIVATDYKDDYKTDCELETSIYGDSYLCDRCTRIQKLSKREVKVLLGIDGTKLHKTESLKSYQFSRIHWNCPHDGKNIKERTLPKLIGSFFMSCAKIQKPSHRVHMTLVQPSNWEKRYYQGPYYGIVKAASSAGYTLIKKRPFGSDRYEGYQHAQTNNNTSAPVTEKGMREFVFEKLDDTAFQNVVASRTDKSVRRLAQALAKHAKKTYSIGDYADRHTKCLYDYYECPTDDDSSDCEAKE